MNLEKLNHFEKFDLETNFAINLENLETQYLKLQQKFHPDKAQDQAAAEINSILINQAYKILKNPISRAIYLLQLHKINIDDENCSIKPDFKTLEFIMNLREQIAEEPTKTQQIKEKITIMIAEEMTKITGLLITKKYSEAAQKLILVKYLDKIINDLKLRKL